MVILISNKYNPRFTVKELFYNNVAYNTIVIKPEIEIKLKFCG